MSNEELNWASYVPSPDLKETHEQFNELADKYLSQLKSERLFFIHPYWLRADYPLGGAGGPGSFSFEEQES